MPITVAMIEEKEFKTKVRGYDPAEVDEFLDDICDEMVAMQEEIAALQARLAQASHAPAYAPAPAPVIPQPVLQAAPRKEENAESSEVIRKMLENTQRICDETIAQARRDAEKITAGAQGTAAAKDLEQLAKQRDNLKKEIETLRASASDFRTRFLNMLDEQREVLETTPGLI